MLDSTKSLGEIGKILAHSQRRLKPLQRRKPWKCFPWYFRAFPDLEAGRFLELCNNDITERRLDNSRWMMLASLPHACARTHAHFGGHSGPGVVLHLPLLWKVSLTNQEWVSLLVSNLNDCSRVHGAGRVMWSGSSGANLGQLNPIHETKPAAADSAVETSSGSWDWTTLAIAEGQVTEVVSCSDWNVVLKIFLFRIHLADVVW